jgi:hypothetical protein
MTTRTNRDTEAAMGDLRVGMSDNEILAHYRQIHPYMCMGEAKELYRTGLKFRRLGAATVAKERADAVENHDRLRERLFGGDEGHDDEILGSVECNRTADQHSDQYRYLHCGR